MRDITRIEGSLVPGRRPNLAAQGHLRALRAQLTDNDEIVVGAGHRLMDWMIRQMCWILNRFLRRACGGRNRVQQDARQGVRQRGGAAWRR